MAVGIYAGEMMARLSPLREVGPAPMEKTALDFSPNWDLAQRGSKQLIQFVNQNPEIIGATVGALFGGVLGSTSARSAKEVAQDPKAPLRNRLSAVVGGAMGGAAVGGLLRGSVTNPLGLANFTQQLSSMGISSASAGKDIGNLFAPQTVVPRTVSEILGKKQQYSDKALFEKYWNEFGAELEEKGPKTKLTDKHREEKFLTALRDLYATASEQQKAPPQKSKANYLLGQAASAVMAPAGVVAQDLISRRLHELSDLTPPPITAKSVSLRSLPSLVGTAARTAKGYRERYIDPGVTVENKADAEARSKFDDGQLRRLLRGLKVEEVKVKQHVIK